MADNSAAKPQLGDVESPKGKNAKLPSPISKHLQEEKKMAWWMVLAYTFGALVALYVFLVGLTLMGTSFKVLGGKGAGNLFSAADNPIAGLMTGILSTVLVQSSSTSTSVVVAMVGADQLTVGNGIPIIMGANIGTSVTNTLVSLGHIGDRIELERAFAGATVHDMFNMLSVLALLPIEAIIGAIQGEGGPLYWITYGITDLLTNGNKGEPLFESPVKIIAKPVAGAILSANKYVIYALSLGKPEAQSPASFNTTLCQNERRLSGSGQDDHVEGSPRALLNRRLESDDLKDCSHYYCVGKDLDKNFKKISKSSYKKLTKCGDTILDKDGEPCGKDDKCFLDAGKYYDEKVTNGKLVKGGFLKEAGDLGGGIIGLILSLVLLSVGMICLTLMLKRIFIGKAKKLIRYALKVNDYLAILIGMAITITVQSSSVCTAALTPLAGIGVLTLVKMLPLTLGANIGTTCTALLASLVSLKFGAVQIALVHLFFNIIGILIWFPFSPMRRIPLDAARMLGLYASYFRALPPIYIFVAFVIIPGISLGISELFKASVAGGMVVLIVLIGMLGAFEFAWLKGIPLNRPPLFDGEPLCMKVLSQDQREEGVRALEAANAAVLEVGEVDSKRAQNPTDEAGVTKGIVEVQALDVQV